MYSFMKKREYGVLNPLRLERAETTRRVYSLQLSKNKELALSHRGMCVISGSCATSLSACISTYWANPVLGGVNSIKIEAIEQR